jgi:citrate lyase subunit beta/citryl-CoA lyase
MPRAISPSGLVRSLMFVPGHQQRMVDKALGLRELDAAILDLEDGVPPTEKGTARDLVTAALATREADRPARLVRVNAIGTKQFEADLRALSSTSLDGVVLPKVESPADVERTESALARVEEARGESVGTTPCVASIESALGLVNAVAIATSSPRVVGLLFGAEDFANDSGMPTTREAEARELLYARSAVVVAAASARKLSFDGIWPDITDNIGLRRDALQARRLGFSGKTLIHPDQIATVNEAFSPQLEELEHAKAMLAAFEQAQTRGEGAIEFRGQLVDAPIVERARRVLRTHEAAESLKKAGLKEA